MDTPRPTARHGDFGGLATGSPASVLRPAEPSEVAAAVRLAAASGTPVAVQGRGHSTHGQSLREGGVLILTRGLSAVGPVLPGGSVVAGAGATWREVLDVTLEHGLTPPVLTDYLDLSVGGTLSAGGIGGTSFALGTQADHVLGLEVVTGTGELLSCSPSSRPDLFDAVRGGLGRCGVIVSARLALVPAPHAVRTVRLGYATAAELVAAQDALARSGGCDDIAGQAKPPPSGGWRYELTATSHLHPAVPAPREPPRSADPGRAAALAAPGAVLSVEETGFAEFADRMRGDVAELRRLGEWDLPHPWAVLFLPGEAAAGLVEEVLSETGPADIGPSGVVLVNPVSVRRVPLLPMPARPWHFGLLRTAADRADAERLVALNRRIFERVRAASGTRYPIDAVPWSAADLERHHGPALPAWRAARARYDPGKIFGMA